MADQIHTPQGVVIQVPEDAVNLDKAIQTFKREHNVTFILGICGGADDDNPLQKFTKERLFGALKAASSLADDERVKLKKAVETAADEQLEPVIREILTPLQNERIAVLTGGTKWGVPRKAVEIARAMEFPTIGVFPRTAFTKGTCLTPAELNLSICVGPFYDTSQWGDEAFLLTKILDAAIVIGGNAGTMVETAHLLKMNEKRAELLWRERELTEAMELTEKEAAELTDVQEQIPRHKLRHIIPIYGTGGTADKLSFFPGKPKTMTATTPPYVITTGKAAAEYLLRHVLANSYNEK